MRSIGIITAKSSLPRIMEIDAQLQSRCNITYLPYSNFDHLEFIYQQNVDNFDGFLFSGEFPFRFLRERHGTIPKPHAFFSVSNGDYYRLVASIAVHHPETDFSRVLFDVGEMPPDFSNIFPDGEMPRFDSHGALLYDSYIAGSYQSTVERYQNWWNSGTLDLIVTRLSNITQQLTDLHIDHQLLFPSQEAMLNTFYGLLMQLDMADAQDAATCIGIVDIGQQGQATAQQRQTLLDSLVQANKQYGNHFLVYPQGNQVQLTVSRAMFKELSRYYTHCPFGAYLEKKVEAPIYIGWGFAQSVVTANENARRALATAKQRNQSASFLITIDNVIVGPLSSANRLTYSDLPSPYIERVSNQLSLSPLYIRKIQAVLKQKGDTIITASELAFFLNITTRSASRLLAKLEAGGVATVQHSRQVNMRGRPTRVYAIDFAKANK